MKKTAIALSVFFALSAMNVIIFADEADVATEIESIKQKIKQQGLSWEAGYNEIMDLPLEQRRQRLGLVVPEHIQEMYDNLDIDPPVIANTQSVFDWRLMNGVTPVTDQGNCGSCWAFAAIAGFESAYLISTGQVTDMSEQAVVSCDQQSDGCNGGWTGSAYNLLIGSGAVDETCMPYEADDNVPCTMYDCDILAYLQSYQPLPNNVEVIKSFLALGPVSTSFTVYDDFFSYQRGCYEHPDTEPTNHAVLIVGWDDNECGGEGAWIVKNSWGDSWGRLGGYFYIKFNSAAIGSNSIVPYYNLTGIGEISYTPDFYDINIQPGQQIVENLEISNVGDGNLRYYINSYTVTDQDEFGYYHRDSDDPDGPSYNWIDITGVGDIVDFWGYNNDGNSGPLDLGFDFTYYGETEDELCICTNGWAALNSAFILEWENDPIPSYNQPNNMLAAFFDNLNLEYGGNIYYYTNNTDTAIITWDNVPDSRQEGTFTFQIILVAPDKIIYQYNSMGPGRLDECTIGIENANGSIGTEVVYNNEYVHDQLAIEFRLGEAPPDLTWMTADPIAGDIEPYNTQNVNITFDATGLATGTYQAMLSIMNTSMESPLVEIPVTMFVEEVLALDDDINNIPRALTLANVYPNPFNASTSISYSLPEQGNVSLEVYNLLGQKVVTLFDGYQSAGYHNCIWDASDVSTGIYLVKLSNGEDSDTKRLTLLK